MMDTNTLAGAAGIILSLAFSYIPGLADRYAALDGPIKRLIMALLIVFVAGAAMLLSCTGLVAVVSCDRPGVTGGLNAIFVALVTNQATYKIAGEGMAMQRKRERFSRAVNGGQ